MALAPNTHQTKCRRDLSIVKFSASYDPWRSKKLKNIGKDQASSSGEPGWGGVPGSISPMGVCHPSSSQTLFFSWKVQDMKIKNQENSKNKKKLDFFKVIQKIEKIFNTQSIFPKIHGTPLYVRLFFYLSTF